MVPNVHLFLCIDKKISPGVVLHCMDLVRAKDWAQDTILVCDESWREFINHEQSVLFLDQSRFFKPSVGEIGRQVNEEELYDFLEQLDDLEINKVTQIGGLSWGRWIQSYVELLRPMEYQRLECANKICSIELINELSEKLKIDLSAGNCKKTLNTDVFLDPYDGQNLSDQFLKILSSDCWESFPQWLRIVVQNRDKRFFMEKGLTDKIIDRTEMEMSLCNQPVLCFSDQSPFALTSRSYNVALYNTETDQSAFVYGDIHIDSGKETPFTEMIHLLSCWREDRFGDLILGCFRQGVEIRFVDDFHHGVVKRNPFSHPSVLYH